jgi:hypothetical protein
MTTTAVDTAVPRTNRALAVTRLHFVNARGVFGMPSIIMGVILVSNISIWAIIFANAPTAQDKADVSAGLQYSGAGAFIFVYMAIVAIQATAVTFPYALGFGVTRRAYFAGTALAFVILTVIYSAALTILGLIEQATNGWGFGGHMFTAIYFGGDTWSTRALAYFAYLLFFFFAGAMFGAVYVRWKGTGITVTFAVLVLATIGVIALLGLVVGWDRTDTAISSLSEAAQISLIFIPTAIAALVSFLVIRRATPRT